tara:strand:- start:109 stop:1353 length:1245 start_codon:yes stop_codon:yes gene_type:complete
MLAVNTLPAVSSSLHSFVIVAPEARHMSTNEVCNVETYNMRGWCRAEVASHASRRGFDNMFLATSTDDIHHIHDNEYSLSETVKVFGGDFTCCRMQHPNGGMCDKEELLEPMLGLYCDVYKRRLSPRLKLFYSEVEHQKEIVYPSYISVSLTDGSSLTRPLFTNLIEMVEKSIDFENMIEAAAGGETNNFRDVVEYELDEEDKENIKMENDLTPILINKFELKFSLEEDEVLLGQGGFGRVVRAEYRGHSVAVKVLRKELTETYLDDEEEVAMIADNLARFRQECLFMKELKHENIVSERSEPRAKRASHIAKASLKLYLFKSGHADRRNLVRGALLLCVGVLRGGQLDVEALGEGEHFGFRFNATEQRDGFHIFNLGATQVPMGSRDCERHEIPSRLYFLRQRVEPVPRGGGA